MMLKWRRNGVNWMPLAVMGFGRAKQGIGGLTLRAAIVGEDDDGEMFDDQFLDDEMDEGGLFPWEIMPGHQFL